MPRRLLENKIPLTFLLALVVHGTAVVWWASNLTTKVDAQEVRLTQTEAARSGLKERLVRIETIVERVEKKIDTLNK